MLIFFKAVFSFLAIFGLIQLCINAYAILNKICFDKVDGAGDVHIIVTVKNQQDAIEGIVKSLVWKSLNNEYGGIVPNILIIDMGSTDETPKILEKLHRDYEFIKIEVREITQ